MTILPLTYLGNIRYFAELLRGECVIDLHENYVKQTYRNRCDILTANGPASLTVNVVKGGSIHKKAMADMRIDYSKRWQHQHWVTLVSAYRNSPYFDHYAERIEPFFTRPYEFLADLNGELLEVLTGMLDRDLKPVFSDKYVDAAPDDRDLRGCFEPRFAENALTFPPYYQVFSERYPFAPNLSVIDLIFCEGPGAAAIIRRSGLL